MQRQVGFLFIYFLSFIYFISPTLVVAAPQSFIIDPMHTYVEWHISHFGFSHPSGKWTAKGTLLLDKENIKVSKVNVTIPIAGLITGLDELNKHLLGKDFFDATKYPLADFVSTQTKVTGKNTADVSGILTLHGIKKPITLKVTFNKAGTNPINNKETVGFSADTTLNRSAFGISTLLPGLSDQVKLHVEVEAYKKP